MRSLVSCIRSLQESGYTDNFKVSNEVLLSPEREKTYKPEEISIRNFYRFEGPSDPADNSILYAIETNDGSKGTLTDSYGPYADPEIEKFIQQVRDIQKEAPVNPDSQSETIGIP